MDRLLLESVLGSDILSTAALSGGEVSEVALVTTLSGRYVVKHNPTAPVGMFTAEAAGLDAIRGSGAIRTPEVVAVQDGPEFDPDERFIVLEYVQPDPDASVSRDFGRTFGGALAQLHRSSPSPFGQYGYADDNFLGRVEQINTWTASWIEFYREYRLAPQFKRARPILGDAARQVGAVIGKLETILAGMPHDPVLVHGDLWSGNYLVSAGSPVLIDPAVYHGHPEIEWAFIDLFGGFPGGMRSGYDEVAALDAGYEYRRPALQLYHLLIHVNHFGASYVPAVDRACRSYEI
jgi:fructosamine-3-kinase